MKERKEDDEIKKLRKAIVSGHRREQCGSWNVENKPNTGRFGGWRKVLLAEGTAQHSDLEKGGSLQVQGQGRGERTGINKSVHNKGGDVGQLDHGRPSV